jgi:hypothetical protein
MLRAIIFRKNIPSNSSKDVIDHILGFDKSLVEITSKQITITRSSGIVHKYLIEFFEKDFFTTTHIGKFESGIPFRLVQPYGKSLEMFNAQNNSNGSFAIGSLNADGYSINFMLFDADEMRNVEVSSEGDDERIKRLTEGAIMALQFGLQNKFVEVTKRLLQFVESNPSIIRRFRDSDILAQYMMQNLYLYSEKEQGIIRRI